MKFDGTDWSLVGAAGISTGAAGYLDIVIDSDEVPFVAFRDAGVDGKLTVMKFNGTEWAPVGTPGFSPANSGYIDLAINSAGSLYVAFTNYEETPLYRGKVMKFNGTDWEAVGGSAGFLARFTTLAFDSADTPYIAYEEGYEEASVRRFNGTDWVIAGSSYFTPHKAESVRLVFDSQGTPYVAFKDWYEESNSWKATVMALKCIEMR